MFNLGDLVLNLYTFLYSLLWALMFVNAEGSDGWGGKSGWVISGKKWFFMNLFTFGRPIRLLPVFGIITFIVSYLFPPLWNISKGFPFTLTNWGELIAYFALFAILEDLLWFLVNPHYGFSKFKKEFIPWHPRWFLRIPIDYWIGVVVFIASGLLFKGIGWTVVVSSIQLFLVAISIYISNKVVTNRRLIKSKI